MPASRVQIPLAKETIDRAMILELIEWLKTAPRLTKGAVTEQFEANWAEHTGHANALFVNSGSSANLLMLYALKVAGRLPSKTIAVPALSWATDLAPVMQLGLRPVLVDANLDDLAVDLEALEHVFKTERPDALILVSVLGLPPQMDQIIDLCRRYDVVLLEDVCESLGSTSGGQLLGTFGLMATYSLYFGHHLSTIEGGMVCTDDPKLTRILKMLRSHGWDRDLDPAEQAELRDRWGVSSFDAAYTFYVPGFNLRATDLQARLGLMQLGRFAEVVDRRNQIFLRYQQGLAALEWSPTVSERDRVSCFAYPVLDARRDRIVAALAAAGIETRPLICGSMGTQPFFVARYGEQKLPVASRIDQEGFYLPAHDRMTTDEVDFVVATVMDAA